MMFVSSVVLTMSMLSATDGGVAVVVQMLCLSQFPVLAAVAFEHVANLSIG